MTSIETIEKICGNIKNRKGVKSYIALVEECGVLSIGAPIAEVPGTPESYHSIDSITLKPDYHFETWYGRKKDADFSFEDDGEQDEEIVKIAGNLYIPKIDGFKTSITNKARGNEFIVLMWDENDPTPRILGEIGNGVTIKVKEQYNAKNGYVLTFAGDMVEKPYWFRGTIPYEV